MKFKLFSLSLFSVSTLFTLAPTFTPAAFAGCVMTDAPQIAIHGSKEPAVLITWICRVKVDALNTTTSTATTMSVPIMWSKHETAAILSVAVRTMELK